MTITFPSALPPGRFTVIGKDSGSPQIQRAVQNVTAKVSDYAHAYLSSDAAGAVVVNPRPAVFPSTPGSSLSLDVTINGQDVAGNPLPAEVVTVILQGPPLPPNATHFEVGGLVISNTIGTLPDPGSDTIAI